MGKDLIKRGKRKVLFILRKIYAGLSGKRKILVFDWYDWVQIDFEAYLNKVVDNSFIQRITKYKFYKRSFKDPGDISDLITLSNFRDFSYDDLNLWEICKSSVYDELIKVKIENSDELSVVKKYFERSIKLMGMVSALFKKERPFALLVEQGFQYDMRTIVEIGRKMGIKTIAVENTFIKDRFFMDSISGGICNRHFLARNSWDILKGMEINPEQRKKSREFMDSYTSQITRGTAVDRAEIERRTSGKRIMLLLGQVPTDASIVMDSPLYRDMVEFIIDSVSAMKKFRDKWHTIIRLHPKESYGHNLHKEKFDNRSFKRLKSAGIDKLDHVTIYKSDEVNTYDLMDMTDCGLTINSQSGLELLNKYKPVITAGDAFYSGKGFTFDVNRKELLPEVIKIAINNLILSEKQKKDIDKFIYFSTHEYMYPKEIPHGRVPRKLLI